MSTVAVVDIGNTSTSVAVACNGVIGPIRFRASWSLTSPKAVSRLLSPVVRGKRLDGAVLCSVVPRLNGVWTAQLKKVAGVPPVVVGHKLKLGVTVDYPKPVTIGADRLANACAAVDRYGAPVIVADFGTAVTFDVVSAAGAYVGGVIAPGLPLMIDYLYERTALLPWIQLKGRVGPVGRSTPEAMRIGAKVGYRGMVRGIVEYLQTSLGPARFHLCATGGFAKWALEGLDMPFSIDPDLTLYGLSRIFELNASRG